MRLRDRAAPARADPPAGRADRPVRRAPAEHQHLRVAGRVVHLQRRQRPGDAVDLRLPGADHEVVVVRVVGDVAGAVGLLDAADPVLQARRAGHRPRPGQRLRVAQVGQELAVRRRSARWRTRPAGPAASRRPGAATARSRWPGSRRRAGRPASGTSIAIRTASSAASKQSAGRARRDDRHRRLAVAAEHAPAAGRTARSWSAGRSTGRRAGCRR